MDMEYIKQNAVGNGKCGENLCWYFLEGTLLISGTGAIILSENMENWEKTFINEFFVQEYPIYRPWQAYIESIKAA